MDKAANIVGHDHITVIDKVVDLALGSVAMGRHNRAIDQAVDIN